jgi:hypothetical protein
MENRGAGTALAEARASTYSREPSPPLKSPLPSSTNPDNYIVNSGADRIIITFPSLV